MRSSFCGQCPEKVKRVGLGGVTLRPVRAGPCRGPPRALSACRRVERPLGWCDDQVEFEFALDLILDGLERLRQTT
jgi:hypothetical protein